MIMIFIIIPILIMAIMEAPVFTIIAALTIAFSYFQNQDWLAIQTVMIEMNRLASMPVLVALPLFTFVGCLLTETKAPQRIMAFFKTVTAPIPGGLAISALLACAFFTALTGASGVTIMALGGILYPSLKKQNYPDKFTLGLLTTGGSLGLLFPPSLPVILYGVVSQTDIKQIYMAGFIPGVILVLGLSIYAITWTTKVGSYNFSNDKSNIKRFSWQEIQARFIAARWDWPILLLPLLGVFSGWMTIYEVSAIVTIYSAGVVCLITQELTWRDLPDIVVNSTLLSGAIIIVLGVSLGFTGYLVDAQIPNRLMGILTAITDNSYIFLAGLNLFLIVVGCVMDIFSAIMIIVPIIYPIAVSYGIDPVHLAVIFLVNLEIGYATPPIGMNLFIASLKFGKPVTLLYRASIPYLLLMVAILALITYLPIITLFPIK